MIYYIRDKWKRKIKNKVHIRHSLVRGPRYQFLGSPFRRINYHWKYNKFTEGIGLVIESSASSSCTFASSPHQVLHSLRWPIFKAFKLKWMSVSVQSENVLHTAFKATPSNGIVGCNDWESVYESSCDNFQICHSNLALERCLPHIIWVTAIRITHFVDARWRQRATATATTKIRQIDCTERFVRG